MTSHSLYKPQMQLCNSATNQPLMDSPTNKSALPIDPTDHSGPPNIPTSNLFPHPTYPPNRTHGLSKENPITTS